MVLKRDRVLMVCTANICRSPMAEKLLLHALRREPILAARVRVGSAGLAALEGEGPSPYSVQVLRRVGIDLWDHTSTYLTQALLDETQVVFCMTLSHVRQLKSSFAVLPPHVLRLRDVLPPDQSSDIADPFGLDIDDYACCRDNMAEAIPAVIEFLKPCFNLV